MDHLQDLEERIAHLTRLSDDLSEVVAGQAARIDVLERKLAVLVAREAERTASGGDGGVYLGDERPPHW